MRSEFAQWLDELQHIANKENITVAARHYDVLNYWFVCKSTPEWGFEQYKKFLKRWNAITENGKNTEALP